MGLQHCVINEAVTYEESGEEVMWRGCDYGEQIRALRSLQVAPVFPLAIHRMLVYSKI